MSERVMLSHAQVVQHHTSSAETNMAMSFAFEQAWKELQRRVPESRRLGIRKFLRREIHDLVLAGGYDTNSLRDRSVRAAGRLMGGRPVRRPAAP